MNPGIPLKEGMGWFIGVVPSVAENQQDKQPNVLCITTTVTKTGLSSDPPLKV